MPIVVIPLAAAAAVFLVLYFAGEILHITPFQGISHFGGTVGGLILRWFANGIQWAIDQSLGDIKAGIRGIEGIIIWPAYWAKTHTDAITNRLYQGYLVDRRIMSTIIPGAVNASLGTARGWVNQAEALAANESNSVLSWAGKQFTTVYADIAAAQAAEAKYAAGLFNSAENYTRAGLAAESAFAQELFNSAITYTDSQVHGVESWVTGEIATVTGWAGGEITALQKYITAIGAAASAFTIARVAVVESELDTLERECTDNLCSGVGGLASLLNALAGDLGIAGLIALATEAARDPKGTASLIEGAFGPVAREGASIMRAACGV